MPPRRGAPGSAAIPLVAMAGALVLAGVPPQLWRQARRFSGGCSRGSSPGAGSQEPRCAATIRTARLGRGDTPRGSRVGPPLPLPARGPRSRKRRPRSRAAPRCRSGIARAAGALGPDVLPPLPPLGQPLDWAPTSSRASQLSRVCAISRALSELAIAKPMTVGMASAGDDGVRVTEGSRCLRRSVLSSRTALRSPSVAKLIPRFPWSARVSSCTLADRGAFGRIHPPGRARARRVSTRDAGRESSESSPRRCPPRVEARGGLHATGALARLHFRGSDQHEALLPPPATAQAAPAR